MGINACLLFVCVHSFCDDCWRQHFRAMISEGKARDLRSVCLRGGWGAWGEGIKA